MPRINHADIARELKLARITVTKALSNHSDISAETKEKVRKMADQLGYIPNLVGRNLATRKTFTIGVVVPKIAHSFFSASIEYFFEAATAKGYELIPMVSFEDEQRQKRCIENLIGMNVDGLVLDIASNTSDLSVFEKIKKIGVPVVFFDRAIPGFKSSGVFCDDKHGSKNAVSFAIKKGHRQIVHFSGFENVSIGLLRSQGYKEAMLEKNLKPHIISAGFTEEAGYEAFKNFISHNALPEALFTVNDSVAHGVYRAAEEAGIRIPDEIGVIGFGDLESSRLLSPPLTSVAMPVKEMATAAVQMLIDQVEGRKNGKQSVVLKTSLSVRESLR